MLSEQAGTGIEKAIKLTASIKDCACCGAATSSGGWLSFMCHNLGADESLDPFVWNNSKGDRNGFDIKGDLYQWGRRQDGHEKRNSTVTTSTAGTITPPHSMFIAPSYSADWLSTVNNVRWGDGSKNENMPKGVNDPCPAGWKVPSQKQWESVSLSNHWQWTGFGMKVGQNLYLPAADFRTANNPNVYQYAGVAAFYWSSTPNGNTSAYALGFTNTNPSPHYQAFYNRTGGLSVRCVQE